jgi:signal transduction histidine kinase
VHPTSLALASAPPVESELALPRPPGVVRRFWARHPWLTDSLVAASYVVPAIGFTLVIAFLPASDVEAPSTFGGVAALLVGGVALVWRRRRPWLVLAISWACTLIAAPLLAIADAALILYAMYAVAAYRPGKAAWIGFGTSVVVGSLAGMLSGNILRPDPDPEPLISTVSGSLFFAVPLLIVMLIGRNIGGHRRYIGAILDRASTLVREREHAAQLAAISERSRIAREMHDIVSHSLTVMVTLAEGSAAVTATDPERATAGTRLVAETGRTALIDMRRMLGVLDATTREGHVDIAASLEPQPGIAALDGLVERFLSAGLPVRFTTRGRTPDDQAVQLAIYRIVQESLTNALRHAIHPTVVEVDIRFRRGAVTISVTDDGAPTSASATSNSHGILGMRERVALYAGEVTSGPEPGGGWRVTATLNHGRDPL